LSKSLLPLSYLLFVNRKKYFHTVLLMPFLNVAPPGQAFGSEGVALIECTDYKGAECEQKHRQGNI
jgi:hypothetical protein